LDWRLAIALATALWGALLAVIVEALSLGHALHRTGLLFAWVGADLALWIPALRLARQQHVLSLHLMWRRFQDGRQAIRRLPLFARLCWIAGALIATFLLAVAATTPPTNWDALSYHLPRVLHWIQQQSVEHFPTENTRQLEFGPWAAFVSAHLFLLEGTDRLVNLPQWIAMVWTTVLLSLLVELLGRYCRLNWCLSNDADAQRKRQNAGALAALVGATVPMGMMQALTPQTDYITTFWVTCLYVFAMALFLEPDQPLLVVGLALALSLAVLTKSTGLIYAAPLAVWCGVWALARRARRAWKLKFTGTVVGAVLLLNAPHALRNYALFGSPLGSRQIQEMVRNQRITPGVFASNLIRNLALHNNCGVAVVTRTLNRAAVGLHSLTGERLDDPRTTYPPGPVKFHDRFLLYDDYASAPLHLLAILGAILLASCRGQPNWRLLLYAGSIVASCCLFLALLKYQVWHSRFHLAYLIVFSPLVAIAVVAWSPRWSRALLAPGVCFYAAFCLLQNEARPIFNRHFARLTRERQYLDIHGSAWNPALERIASDIVASGCNSVGLKLGFDAFEYPIWMMLRNRGFRGRIDHYYVEHVSARLASDALPPCAIIAKLSQPPAAVTNSYPYRTERPPLMVLWTHEPPDPVAKHNYVRR
jgi:hypothetical protein